MEYWEKIKKSTRCPVCNGVGVDIKRWNNDDGGVLSAGKILYKCKNCGRSALDYQWNELTDKEQLKIIKEQLEELEKNHMALLACVEGKIPDIPFVQQVEILLNRIKRIVKYDGNGDCVFHLVKPQKTKYSIAPDSPIFKRAEKVTKFTIYLREIIE